ncbi:YdeI/OmpD-associated family protein [Microbacteriaceae bacterium K1510]|nr:YdeI/OmpD-associated family protein [Microbacteriaceae bacterium K1510]
MTERKGLPILGFANARSWDAWLDKNEESSPGLWLKFAKKNASAKGIGKAEAIEVALAHGWIDGQLASYDESFWLVRFTRRGRTSKWSQANQTTATKLIEQKRMKPSGLREVKLAKSDGRWDAAYASQSKAVAPDDFVAALEAKPKAQAFFATLKAAERYSFLYRVNTAKTAETRAALIEKFVGMLTRGKTIHGGKKRG